jgi:DNA-binding NtrC family response regulator
VASAALVAPASGVRVLVIEDDPTVREIVKRTLVRAGHAVVAVATAADGLRAFDIARPTFDAALIDLVLPDRSGGVLARALRRRRPDLAVVYMSGYGDSEGPDREPGVFIAKPFTGVQLADALQRALAQVLAATAGAAGAEPQADLA